MSTGALDDELPAPSRVAEEAQPKHRLLRWAVFVPAAFVASLLAPATVYVLHWFFAPENQSRFDKFFLTVAQSAAMGAAFVWAGSVVAPSHHGKVAISLAAAAIFMLGGIAVLALRTHQWTNLVHVIISAGAAACTGYVLHEEKS